MDFGVEMDGSQDFFQMFWPVVVSHKIDEKSPLYNMCARDIAEHTFEIILTMEGITPETGNTVQVRILSTSFIIVCWSSDNGDVEQIVTFYPNAISLLCLPPKLHSI